MEEQLTKKQKRAIRRQQKLAQTSNQERRMGKNRVLLWTISGILITGLIGGTIWIASTVQQPDASGANPTIVSVQVDDWVRGNPQASVTLIEYSDLQCPACGSFYALSHSLLQEKADQVRFVYRHLPLTSLHPNAQIAAQAAEASGKQNKFWEMHDYLFEQQTAWSSLRNPEETFAGYAETLGLDRTQFIADIKSKEVRQAVTDDAASGAAAGLQSTPSLFLNGKRIQPGSRADLQKLLDEAIAANPSSTTNVAPQNP